MKTVCEIARGHQLKSCLGHHIGQGRHCSHLSNKSDIGGQACSGSPSVSVLLMTLQLIALDHASCLYFYINPKVFYVAQQIKISKYVIVIPYIRICVNASFAVWNRSPGVFLKVQWGFVWQEKESRDQGCGDVGVCQCVYSLDLNLDKATCTEIRISVE